MTSLTALYDEMSGLVDEARAVGIVFLDFSKAFNTNPGKNLRENLLMYGPDEQTVKWTENWLNSQDQRVVISSTKSSWSPVTSSILSMVNVGSKPV